MRAKLSCGVVAVLLIGAGATSTPDAGAKVEFPTGSRWELVRGWKGMKAIAKASLVFRNSNKLELIWGTDPSRDDEIEVTYYLSRWPTQYGEKLTYPFEDAGLWLRGTIRRVGNRIEVKAIDHDDKYEKDVPAGELYLLLKRVK